MNSNICQFNKNNNCPHCQAQNRVIQDFTQGTMVCTSCGFVVEERFIDYSREWNKFNDDGNNQGPDPSRANGGIVDLYAEDNELGIEVTPKGKMGKQFYQLLLYQTFQSYKQKKNSKVISSLKNLGKKLSQSEQVVYSSIDMYKQLSQKSELKGKAGFLIAIGILLIECRKEGINVISIETVAQQTGKSSKKISKALKLIQTLAPSQLYDQNQHKNNLVNSIAQKMQLPINLNIQCQKIADKITEEGLLEGKNPKTISSVAIYIGTQLTNDSKKSIKEIAASGNVAEVTIKRAYQTVYANLNDIVHQWEGRLAIEFLPQNAK